MTLVSRSKSKTLLDSNFSILLIFAIQQSNPDPPPASLLLAPLQQNTVGIKDARSIHRVWSKHHIFGMKLDEHPFTHIFPHLPANPSYFDVYHGNMAGNMALIHAASNCKWCSAHVGVTLQTPYWDWNNGFFDSLYGRGGRVWTWRKLMNIYDQEK